MKATICGTVLALAALAVAPLVARAEGAPPTIKLAVFDFELEDSSPSAVLLNKPVSSAATMEKVSSGAREELAKSGRYSVVDGSTVNAKPVREKALRNCDGCEAGFALQLGADQSLIGVVRKITETDYYLMIRIRDARTGKTLEQEEAMFAGDETGWVTGARMLIRHQVLPVRN